VFSLNGSVADVEPESDESTYNGAQWLLARSTFWTDPTRPPPVTSNAYARALAFYKVRAVRDSYRWSWRNAQLEQNLYQGLIEQGNVANHRAISALGVIAANHVLSLVDAFATWRLQVRATPQGEYQLRSAISIP
jgi:hypothetical protein